MHFLVILVPSVDMVETAYVQMDSDDPTFRFHPGGKDNERMRISAMATRIAKVSQYTGHTYIAKKKHPDDWHGFIEELGEFCKFSETINEEVAQSRARTAETEYHPSSDFGVDLRHVFSAFSCPGSELDIQALNMRSGNRDEWYIGSKAFDFFKQYHDTVLDKF